LRAGRRIGRALARDESSSRPAKREKRREAKNLMLTLIFLSEFDVVDVLDFDFLSDLMRLTWLTLIFWSNLIC
jgi:hypothetical protein